MDRRSFLAGATALAASTRASAQHNPALPPAPSSPEPYAKLDGGAPHHITPEQEAQRVTDSPAPKGPQGRWETRPALPLPRSEMAWATSFGDRLYIVGGYGEGRVDRAYNHIFDPAAKAWLSGAPLPRGANHVAIAADSGRVYALGGFLLQNTSPDDKAFAYDIAADRWDAIAPLPRPRGAGAAVVLDGRIYLIGGASAPASERASVGWHEVYDPKTDRWEMRKALPGARDHVGCVAHRGAIHVIGGRFNTFEYNTDLHHVYLPERDTWELRAPLPTARSGHGLGGLSRPAVRDGRRVRRGPRPQADPGQGLRTDGELRSRHRQLAEPRPDADAAPCGRRGGDRRLDLRRRRRCGDRRGGAIRGPRGVYAGLTRTADQALT